MNYWPVVAATVASFASSSAWYAVFGKARMKLLADEPGATADMKKVPAWKVLAELGRSFVVAYVLARLVVSLGVADWWSALQLGFWVWLGFPFMILVGSVLWDQRPWRLAAIHVGDWLVKLLLVAVILGAWRR